MSGNNETKKHVANLITTLKGFNFVHEDDTVSSLSSSSTNSQYPTAKAVFDALQNVGGGSDIDDFYIDTTNDEIVIVTESGGGSSIIVDSTWVNNSTNPVQSQLIKEELDDLNDKIGDILTVINGSGSNG